MKVILSDNPKTLGENAAALTARLLRDAISKQGSARLLMSTGASQFDTIKALVREDVDWSVVDVFHLDEYIDMPDTHPASFRKYIRERFADIVHPRRVNYVDAEGDVEKNIRNLTEELRREPIDVGLIGIGENAHIAFNDPPADFETKDAYIIVDLDMKCRNQQLREGWFKTLDDVPRKAVSMSVSEIMKCKNIISAVPYKVKAQAIRDTLENELTPYITATMLKTHKSFSLFVDRDSASLVDIAKYQ